VGSDQCFKHNQEVGDIMIQLVSVKPERPAGHEYFDISHGFDGNKTLGCFVCNESVSSYGIKAFIENEAADRVAKMFGKGFHFGYQEDSRISIFIGVCRNHQKHINILCKLVEEDDLISYYRIYRARSALTREQFTFQVRHAAYHNWTALEHQRSVSNWNDAGRQLYQELGRLIKREELEQRARELWLKRKDAEAYQDWEAGEKWAHEIYEVID